MQNRKLVYNGIMSSQFNAHTTVDKRIPQHTQSSQIINQDVVLTLLTHSTKTSVFTSGVS